MRKIYLNLISSCKGLAFENALQLGLTIFLLALLLLVSIQVLEAIARPLLQLSGFAENPMVAIPCCSRWKLLSMTKINRSQQHVMVKSWNHQNLPSTQHTMGYLLVPTCAASTQNLHASTGQTARWHLSHLNHSLSFMANAMVITMIQLWFLHGSSMFFILSANDFNDEG